jgi:hypothetical protein
VCVWLIRAVAEGLVEAVAVWRVLAERSVFTIASSTESHCSMQPTLLLSSRETVSAPDPLTSLLPSLQTAIIHGQK